MLRLMRFAVLLAAPVLLVSCTDESGQSEALAPEVSDTSTTPAEGRASYVEDVNLRLEQVEKRLSEMRTALATSIDKAALQKTIDDSAATVAQIRANLATLEEMPADAWAAMRAEISESLSALEKTVNETNLENQ